MTQNEYDRQYVEVASEDFETLAEVVASGYFTANRAVDRIEAELDALVETLTAIDDDEVVHAIGLEFEVSADVDVADELRDDLRAEIFDAVSGTIGLSILWFLPDELGPEGDDGDDEVAVGPPAIRLFARGSEGDLEPFDDDPPDADLEDDEVETNGLLFVAHYNGDLEDTTYESWYDAFDVGPIDDQRALLDPETFGSLDDTETGSAILAGFTEAWYLFGADLAIDGSDEAQAFAYRNGRYEHFPWLLDQLELGPPVVTDEDRTHWMLSAGIEPVRLSVPRWSSLETHSGGFGIADSCGAYRPATDDTIVVDELEHSFPDETDPELGDVTNWRDDETVHHFIEAARGEDENRQIDVPWDDNCLDNDEITKFIIHETAGGANWERENQAQMDGRAGIHLSIPASGDVYVHNDLTEQLIHASGDANDDDTILDLHSFGVEIVNPYHPEHGWHDGDWDRTIDEVVWADAMFAGDDAPADEYNGYVVPNIDQLESVTHLIDWTLNDDAHGLAVDDEWIGFFEEVEDEDGNIIQVDAEDEDGEDAEDGEGEDGQDAEDGEGEDGQDAEDGEGEDGEDAEDGEDDEENTPRAGFVVDAHNLQQAQGIDDAIGDMTDESGIWAHSYYHPTGRTDGIFPVLYAWLRLEGGIDDPEEALEIAEDICDADEDEYDIFTDQAGDAGYEFVDVVEFIED